MFCQLALEVRTYTRNGPERKSHYHTWTSPDGEVIRARYKAQDLGFDDHGEIVNSEPELIAQGYQYSDDENDR